MYEDRRETFSIKDIFLQLLFIILLVFILIWLFPTKGYLEKKLDGIELGINEKLQPLYTRLFTDNILTMKDAAKSYFTTPRLPQTVGDKVTMTLEEMYEKGLLLELVDSNNNSCDAKKSFVEITKTDEEYELKVSLSCSDKEAFIIEHLGCYDYCNGRLCTKEESRTNQIKTYTCKVIDGQYWGSNATVVDVATYNSQCGGNPVTVDKYKYEYVKTVGGTCSFGKFGEWTTNKIEENENTKVETKTEKELDYYEQVYTVVDTKYVDQEYYEDVNYGYSTRTIKRTTVYDYTTTTTNTVLSFATRTKQKTTDYEYKQERVATGTTWVAAGQKESKTALVSNATEKYTLISTRQEMDCTNACQYVNIYVYKVEKAQTTYTTTNTCSHIPGATDTGSGCRLVETVTENWCPQGEPTDGGCLVTSSDKKCAQGDDIGTGCQVVTYIKQNYCAAGGSENEAKTGCVIKVKKTKKVPELIYGYVNGNPVYKDVLYYRAATRNCTDSTVDYKWSESNNDESLKNQGYTLTGKSEKI